MTTSVLSSRLLSGAAAAALAVTGIAVGIQPAQAAAAGTTTDAVNLRSGTSTSTQALGTIPGGTQLQLECQSAGQSISGTYNTNFWAKVNYNGTEGYVSRAYVTVPDGSGLGDCGADAPEAPAQPAPDVDAQRQEVLDRGQTWVDRNVPYSMSNYTNGPDGKQWRTDCSGFVSMAYDLDQSYSTVTLEQHFTPIAKEDLQPGDIIGNLGAGSAGAAGHVVIFTGWTDESKTTFTTIEQAGGVGGTAQTHTWGDSFWNQQAYRYNGF